MNGIFIVPTGIGAEIGGHAGDATSAFKMIAKCCDTAITHPNVVNASDINEMPENTWYVEGSILNQFLGGKINLKQPKQNKILVVANKPIENDTINAVNSSIYTIGANIELIELEEPLIMEAVIDLEHGAGGNVAGWEALCHQVEKLDFDALAIHTQIHCHRNTALEYFKNGGINPWGGIEAIASKLIAERLNKPVAHAPKEYITPDDEELYFIFNADVNARMAPEVISCCYLHCCLKGLNKAPRITYAMDDLTIDKIDFMVSPMCFGEPHKHCNAQGIPIVYVKENTTIQPDIFPINKDIVVDNYLEATGVIMAMKAGVFYKTVRK